MVANNVPLEIPTRALISSDGETREAAHSANRVPVDLVHAVIGLRALQTITVNRELIAAFQAASSPHSIRALKSDLEAFDLWCRRNRRIALPATPGVVADYLDARAGQGGKPASLSRYKASIAKIHQLLGLTDPTPTPLVKLRLAAIRREKGTAQKQARPLRFKGPVRDAVRDAPRGINIRALLLACRRHLKVCAPDNDLADIMRTLAMPRV